METKVLGIISFIGLIASLGGSMFSLYTLIIFGSIIFAGVIVEGIIRGILTIKSEELESKLKQLESKKERENGEDKEKTNADGKYYAEGNTLDESKVRKGIAPRSDTEILSRISDKPIHIVRKY